jgi:Mn2+/Fe2+ NRAMP family transporter
MGPAGVIASDDGQENYLTKSVGKPALIALLGPGLLFAGTAVGTSHLVQSTRAGAVFGLGLLLVVVLANVVKYPAFRFGAHYGAVTGRNLVDGYRRLGLWPVLFLAAVLIVADGFAVAAISLVTGGIVKAVFGLQLGLFTVVGGVMALTGLFLIVGRYHWLERLNKLFMLILSLSTIAATILVLPRIDWTPYPATAPAMDLAALMFVAALAGWMPTPIETSVFSSLWTIEKAKDLGRAPPLSSVALDFNLGYWGTAFLAICFLFLGAGILHAEGTPPADSPAGFALQVMGLYEETLGAWSTPIIGAAAISVMFTTCLSVYDGVARSLVAVSASLRDGAAGHQVPKRAYPMTVAGLLVVAFVLLLLFVSSFQAFIDFVTSLAFVTAPVLAYLNHRVIMRDVVPGERPPAYLMVWSRVGIAVLGMFAVAYLWLVAMR